MEKTLDKFSPISPMMGIQGNLFKSSPMNVSSDSSFEGLKPPMHNLKSRRSFSPNVFIASPNISPVATKLRELTIKEEAEEKCDTPKIEIQNKPSPQTPLNTGSLNVNVLPAGASYNQRKRRNFYRPSINLSPEAKPNFNITLNSSNFLNHTFCMSMILREIKLGKYIELFEKEEINVQAFLTLNEQDLETIGIFDPGEKKALLDAIKTYTFLLK